MSIVPWAGLPGGIHAWLRLRGPLAPQPHLSRTAEQGPCGYGSLARILSLPFSPPLPSLSLAFPIDLSLFGTFGNCS